MRGILLRGSKDVVPRRHVGYTRGVGKNGGAHRERPHRWPVCRLIRIRFRGESFISGVRSYGGLVDDLYADCVGGFNSFRGGLPLNRLHRVDELWFELLFFHRLD